ncbi:MAG: hypothetical protein KME26_16240 [Oscillatoria princeps RMCB-10]|jgi:hypothetical protein|nr:hypothetical protein [Oscillatoria princeps RMCB-10]
MADTRDFLSPRSRYHGKFTPQNLAFDANLQEFAQKVSIICALETGGKLSSEQAYEEIRTLWHRLKTSKKHLGIGEPPPEASEDKSEG